MAIFHGNSISSGDSTYTIDNSCRFNDDDAPTMSRTFGTPTNAKIGTLSFWCKLGKLMNSSGAILQEHLANKIFVGFDTNSSGDYTFSVYLSGQATKQVRNTTRLFRDHSAWYHVILAFDTTDSTASERLKLYVNGELITDYSTNVTITQNLDVFTNALHYIGSYSGSHEVYDGYLAEMHFIDGQALGSANFGETGDYGEWKPIQYTGSHGTNGFYLDFADSSDFGNDASANSNNFTVANITASDQVKDSPTNNFCTMNPLDNYYAGSTFSQGNLGLFITTSAQPTSTATFGMTSGKWYWEVRQGSSGVGGGGLTYVGYLGIAGSLGDASNSQLGEHYDQYSLYAYSTAGRNVWHNSTWYSYGTDITYTNGDIISMALDLDNNKMYWAKNGSYVNSGNPAGNSNGFSVLAPSATSLGAYFPAAGDGHSSSENFMFNFGQEGTFAGNVTAGGNSDDNGIGNFKYAPPAGFLSLCTANLPEPTVIPSEHFNAIAYTGDGSQDVTGVGFQPDLVWCKARGVAYHHQLHDSVRGATAGMLNSNQIAAENSTFQFDSFDSDGYTTDSGNVTGINGNTETHVAWNWKAGGAPTADNSAGVGATPTAGSVKIDGANLGSALAGSLAVKRQSANTTNGFSITWYDGTASEVKTVAHGLSEAPDLVTIKKLNGSGEGWQTGSIHPLGSMDFTDALYLHDQIAISDSASWWNDTAPSSTVVTLGGNSWNNASSSDYIMYCWHSVEGYSKIGAYKGNGNVDGTFVYTGFKPAFVICKKMDATGGWIMHDNARNPSNLANYGLLANTSPPETSGDNMIDLLSNGFKRRAIDAHGNATNSYMYYAIAEQPFKHSNAR